MAEHPKQDKTPAEVEKSKVEDIKRLLIGHLESEPKIPQTIDFSHLRDILYDEQPLKLIYHYKKLIYHT